MIADEPVTLSAVEHANLVLVAHAPRTPEVLKETGAQDPCVRPTIEHVVNNALHLKRRTANEATQKRVGVVPGLGRFVEHFV